VFYISVPLFPEHPTERGTSFPLLRLGFAVKSLKLRKYTSCSASDQFGARSSNAMSEESYEIRSKPRHDPKVCCLPRQKDRATPPSGHRLQAVARQIPGTFQQIATTSQTRSLTCLAATTQSMEPRRARQYLHGHIVPRHPEMCAARIKLIERRCPAVRTFVIQWCFGLSVLCQVHVATVDMAYLPAKNLKRPAFLYRNGG
jgi:hypothetical protein